MNAPPLNNKNRKQKYIIIKACIDKLKKWYYSILSYALVQINSLFSKSKKYAKLKLNCNKAI